MKRTEIFQHLLLLYFWIYYHVTWGISLHYCLLINLHLQSFLLLYYHGMSNIHHENDQICKYMNTKKNVHVCGMSSNMFGIDLIDLRIYTQIETLYRYFWDQPGPTLLFTRERKKTQNTSSHLYPMSGSQWELSSAFAESKMYTLSHK